MLAYLMVNIKINKNYFKEKIFIAKNLKKIIYLNIYIYIYIKSGLFSFFFLLYK